MVRDYKKKVQSPYKDYSHPEIKKKLEDAVNSVKSGQMNLLQAEIMFGIPRSTIRRKKNGEHMGPVGHPTVYSPAEELGFVNVFKKLSDFGFPAGIRELKIIVQSYNHKQGKMISIFTDNLPGNDWVSSFLKRHPDLSQRMASNIKRSMDGTVASSSDVAGPSTSSGVPSVADLERSLQAKIDNLLINQEDYMDGKESDSEENGSEYDPDNDD